MIFIYFFGEKLFFIFHFNVMGNFNKCISHDNSNLSLKNVNIKAYEINKNKEKFEFFATGLN
jgi:hypothetical protein